MNIYYFFNLKKQLTKKRGRTLVWESWQILLACPRHWHILVLSPQLRHSHYQGQGPASLFPTHSTGSHCPFFSPFSLQACMDVLWSQITFTSLQTGMWGAVEDGGGRTSVIFPGHKPRLGRGPGKESQSRVYPLQGSNPGYVTLNKSRNHSEPQFPHLKHRNNIMSAGL